MSKRIASVEDKMDEYSKAVIEISTSGKWAKALTAMLVPFFITAIVSGILMYSNQLQFGAAMTRHFDNHESSIAPTLTSNREDIIGLKADHKATSARIDHISGRVSAVETKVRTLSVQKIEKRRRR